MTRIVLASVLFLCVAESIRGDDDSKKALEALKGEWQFVSYTHADSEIKLDKAKSRVVFTDEKMTITFAEREAVSAFTLDAKTEPKALDVMPPGEKFVAKAIWKLEKDRLTICFAISGGERPKNFAPAKNNSVMVLERPKK